MYNKDNNSGCIVAIVFLAALLIMAAARLLIES